MSINYKAATGSHQDQRSLLFVYAALIIVCILFISLLVTHSAPLQLYITELFRHTVPLNLTSQVEVKMWKGRWISLLQMQMHWGSRP